MSQLENIAIFGRDADRYDLFRIAPPAIIIDDTDPIVRSTAGARHRLGLWDWLSTTIWSDAADETIGIEPNIDMRTQASALVSERGNPSVTVREVTPSSAVRA